MTIEEAKVLLEEEFSSDHGLDLLFRMSADIEESRITQFLQALSTFEKHYRGKDLIERDWVYKLTSMSNTLRASQGHWKVEHPKGLDPKTCFEIHRAVFDIFTD